MTATGMTSIRGRAVTPGGVREDALVRIEAGRIVEVATGGEADLTAAWIVPGFVDLHVHGGGGHTFTNGDPDEARAAAAFHAGHGTTTLQASLVTTSPEATRAAVAGLAPLVHSGLLAGVHLEGPYLSTARCGAQNPAYLRDPDADELAGLLAFGAVRTVTIAPELPGALTAIRRLSAHGVIAAVGHTDATYEQTLAAIEAGATLATHLCNAMRPIHHRDPGPIVALLDAEGVVCEQIADGVHLHDAMLGHVIRVAGSDRVALITDAIAATGMADGDYELGGQRVTVDRGVARLASNGTIAGSTLTMDAALRRAVHSGISIVDAVRMASTTPARVLGRSDEIGAIAEGLRADLVLLDESLEVLAVISNDGIQYGP
jgi:N-acetylglucosamine-6-phosphate deacetylase